MMNCNVRESFALNCDLKTRLLCSSGKTLGLMACAVATQAGGWGGFRSRLIGVALQARKPV